MMEMFELSVGSFRIGRGHNWSKLENEPVVCGINPCLRSTSVGLNK